MTTALAPSGGAPALKEAPHPEQPIIWWTNWAARTSQFVMEASFYPVLAALEQFRLVCGAVLPPGAGSTRGSGRQGGVPGDRPNSRRGVPGMTRRDLDELKQALEEYEDTRGDWSKGR